MTFRQKIQRARDLIKLYSAKYPKHGVALSFGKDSMVLVDIARRINPNIFVFGVLSNSEFPQTLRLRDETVKRWGLNYKEFKFKNNPNNGIENCCRAAKVRMFKTAVKELDVWFSGIRKDEGFTRKDFEEVNVMGGLIKVNPILNFTEKDIWRYSAVFALPVNSLYKNYRSLSCSNCSVVEKDEEDSERAGRWAGTEHQGKECGIHTQILKK